MLPDRYYVADVHEGPKQRRLYFYANVEGLTDPEYGYIEDNRWIEDAYRFVANEAEKRLSVQPVGFEAVPEAVISVSEPREICREEMASQDPRVNGPVLKAIDRTKVELEEALRPIRVVWHWQVSEAAGGEAAVHLKLEDDVTSARRAFTVGELADDSVMRDRIRGLYQELLRISSRKLILNLLRQNAGAGKD